MSKKTYADKCLEIAGQATEGPWKNDCGNGQVETEDWRVLICNRVGNLERLEDVRGMFPDYNDVEYPEVARQLDVNNECDMDFIAAARIDVPELARRLKEAIRAMRSAGRLFNDESLLDWANELEAPLEKK